MTTELLREEVGRVLVLTINRPERRNAMTLSLSIQLAKAFDELDERPDLTVAVITGAGGTFCAGMDLKRFAEGEVPIVPGRGFAGLVERPPSKPLIAAVEGHALGGGFEIALATDMIVASASATFGLPEVTRGLTANAGGLLRLPRRLPFHIAMELILTGRPLPAAEAHELRLVNRLTNDGDALESALELAQRVAANAPLAVAASKAVVVDSDDWPVSERFVRQHDYIQPVRESADALEGAQAFLQKRPPLWVGA